MASLEGQTLGKYRVLEPLGRGGMARVYRAYHPRLDRYVAIKVMRPDLVEDGEFLARFQREARAVAALRHPNIIQVYDFDVQDDIYYMVMELMEGDTLKARLTDYRVQGERMAWGEMVRIILDVLDGLAYAHSERIIHRDLKPANILLTRRGEAVIGDFGITHIIGGTRRTERGALIGTLEYMAPEQGLSGRCDAYSDIYSLGVVFYEMLTQRTPFDADTPLAVLMKHINDPLPLPAPDRSRDPGAAGARRAQGADQTPGRSLSQRAGDGAGVGSGRRGGRPRAARAHLAAALLRHGRPRLPNPSSSFPVPPANSLRTRTSPMTRPMPTWARNWRRSGRRARPRRRPNSKSAGKLCRRRPHCGLMCRRRARESNRERTSC